MITTPRLATTPIVLALCSLAACAGLPGESPTRASTAGEQDNGAALDQASIEEMMAAAADFTQPGPEHEFLGMLVGDYAVTAQVTLMGPDAPRTAGHAEIRWLVEGRFIQNTWSGELMGMQGLNIVFTGYDRLKKSFVWTGLGDFDTAMNRAEGDLTPDGRALIMYGTLDEYLTGEHDKMVKYVQRYRGETDDDGRLTSIDGITLEVHDLAMGETGTKVMEFVYTRTR